MKKCVAIQKKLRLYSLLLLLFQSKNVVNQKSKKYILCIDMLDIKMKTFYFNQAYIFGKNLK